MLDTVRTIFEENVPFYWVPLSKDYKGDIPTQASFKLYYDARYGLFRQTYDERNAKYLEMAYNEGSEIIGLMDDHGIGHKYANDFYNYIVRSKCFESSSDKKKVLEIGCGTGYLLHTIQQSQEEVEVIGYEPGYAQIGKYDIPCVEDYFPTKHIEGQKYDVVIAYGVLEHINDLTQFLQNVKMVMSESGIAIFSVPDCEIHITNGDIAMLLHEHYSYFTKNSFKNLFLQEGYTVLDINEASFGGSIYITVSYNEGKQLTENTSKMTSPVQLQAHIQRNKNRFSKYLADNQNSSIGVYVPIRAMNLLYTLRDNIEKYNIKLRFFDDSINLIGKYLPCFDIPIEDYENLVNDPTDRVIIFSYSFGEQIRSKLSLALPNTSIDTVEEIYL